MDLIDDIKNNKIKKRQLENNEDEDLLLKNFDATIIKEKFKYPKKNS